VGKIKIRGVFKGVDCLVKNSKKGVKSKLSFFVEWVQIEKQGKVKNREKFS